MIIFDEYGKEPRACTISPHQLISNNGILQNLDRGLDYGPNSAGPPRAHISFSPFARTVLYVDLTAKLALPCQLVHRPFDMFNTRECISGRGFVL